MPRPDEVDHGTHAIGGWVRNQCSRSWIWQSDEKDPYNDLTVMDEPDYIFSRDLDARRYTASVIAAHDNDYEFTFGFIKMTLEARLEKAELLERCQNDPDYIVQYFKENYYRDGYWENIVAAAKAESCSEVMVCTNPLCLRKLSPTTHPKMIGRCGACGEVTLVHESLLANGCPPDGMIQVMMAQSVVQVDKAITSQNYMIKTSNDHDYVQVVYHNGYPLLEISTDIPQLRMNGEHFIRGRVNREVMEQSGLRVDLEKIMIRFNASNYNVLRVINLLLSDEAIVLDESMASKFRQEYIDNQWEEEFVNFATLLGERGVLKVDSSGVHDTLNALYNMAQNKSGKKTIIKRNGNIVFPTHDVLDNISQPMIERAFRVTEHGRYDDVTDVFQVGEGAV